VPATILIEKGSRRAGGGQANARQRDGAGAAPEGGRYRVEPGSGPWRAQVRDAGAVSSAASGIGSLHTSHVP